MTTPLLRRYPNTPPQMAPANNRPDQEEPVESIALHDDLSFLCTCLAEPLPQAQGIRKDLAGITAPTSLL